ncbi:MAG: ATPase, T2SS/T4P/T4SS family [Coriobacteriia bacterium]|nr:ATPase, T2SS/T4P/T4SS family [Coriobacteriia bacterium]
MRDVNELLRIVMERGGSDLHITVGVPPTIRLNGRLVPIEDEPCLTPDMTREAVFSIMSQDRRAALEQNLEHDFAYSLPGEARFRVNAYFQRGSLGAAFRLIPVEIRTIADLGLPPVLVDLAMKPRGFVLVTGPTGSGKSTTLAAMIDHINHPK